jgi:putative ATP-dependent endonuclease of OLD family
MSQLPIINKKENIKVVTHDDNSVSISYLNYDGNRHTRTLEVPYYVEFETTNNNAYFSKLVEICKGIFPDIVDIHPYQHTDSRISIFVKKRHVRKEIDLEYEASGLDQLLIIIWWIATSSKGTIWFLDEPELHLHPGAQKLLYDFLKRESETNDKQIFVATHSMVFIHNSRLDEISLILDDKEGTISTLQTDLLVGGIESEEFDTIREHVYEALGYEPRLTYDVHTFVMVEGIVDANVIKCFAVTLDKVGTKMGVKFVPMGGKKGTKYFSPVVAYTLSGRRCLIVFDNDEQNPEAIREEVLKKERQYKESINVLSDSNFIFCPSNVYSIEYYLLEPEAICRAAHRKNDPDLIAKYGRIWSIGKQR